MEQQEQLDKASEYFLLFIRDNLDKVLKYVLEPDKKKAFGPIFGRFKSTKSTLDYKYTQNLFNKLVIWYINLIPDDDNYVDGH